MGELTDCREWSKCTTLRFFQNSQWYSISRSALYSVGTVIQMLFHLHPQYILLLVRRRVPLRQIKACLLLPLRAPCLGLVPRLPGLNLGQRHRLLPWAQRQPRGLEPGKKVLQSHLLIALQEPYQSSRILRGCLLVLWLPREHPGHLLNLHSPLHEVIMMPIPRRPGQNDAVSMK